MAMDEVSDKIEKMLTPYMRVGAYPQEYWARMMAKDILKYLYEQGFRQIEPKKLPVLDVEDIDTAKKRATFAKYAWNEFGVTTAELMVAQAQRSDMLKRLKVEDNK